MKTHQFPPKAAPHASSIWYLEPGHALTYRASQDERLRVTYGRIWLTKANCSQDYVLDAATAHSTELQLNAGESVVIEAWPHGAFEVRATLPLAAAARWQLAQAAHAVWRWFRQPTKSQQQGAAHSACA